MKVFATLLLALLPCAVAAAEAPERLAADSPRTTVDGNTFVAPADWTFSVKPPATILEAPESDTRIVLVGVRPVGPDRSLLALAPIPVR